jgi:hypothetical protein
MTAPVPRRGLARDANSYLLRLGDDGNGNEVAVDIRDSGLFTIEGEPTATNGLIAVLATQLLDPGTDRGTDVVLVGEQLRWLSQLNELIAEWIPNSDDGLSALEDQIRERSALSGQTLDSFHRSFVFAEPIPASINADLAQLGLAVFAPAETGGTLQIAASGQATINDVRFQAETLSPQGLQSAASLTTTVTSPSTLPISSISNTLEPASSAGPSSRLVPPSPSAGTQNMNSRGATAETTGPRLLLLGPVQLTEVSGTRPASGAGQCAEVCGWLLRNRQATTAQLCEELLLPPRTAHTLLLRLSDWLGTGNDGVPYLSETPAGAIRLSEQIGSDADQLTALIDGGISKATNDSLGQALRLIHGAPLADAAPGQWVWAESWRLDMICTIQDIALELGDRALAEDDLELARWALNRGQLCSMASDELTMLQLRIEARSGNTTELKRIADQVTQQARALGYDLSPAMVRVLQETVEGHVRTTAASDTRNR